VEALLLFSRGLTPYAPRTTRERVKQNVTVSLNRETVVKTKILAARRGTSISALLGEQIEALVVRDETYERAKAEAIAFLDTGFHLGGEHKVARAELHER
jgi:hypothetical protein